MVQGYYTLQEAAQLLQVPADELKDLAKKGQIRSFQDRGTLRFRVQDIQELARKRGGTSDPDLVLGDASLPKPRSSATPPSGTKKSPPSPKPSAKPASSPSVFDFDVEGEKVDVGGDLPLPGASKSKPSSKNRRPASPIPAGSDSDVRLVADGSDVTFSIPKEPASKPLDSDVKIAPDPLKPRTGLGAKPTPSSGGKRPSQMAIGESPGSAAKQQSPRPGVTPPVDSGVRLVPLDEDSDVKLLGSSDDVALGEGGPAVSDSNVRLERVSLPPADSGEGDMHLTEEINLDEELKKQQEKQKDQPATRLKAKSELKLPTSSPFELSESDLDLPDELKSQTGPNTPRGGKAENDSSDFDLATQPSEGTSDFDLVPSSEDSVELDADSNDFSLDASDESEQVVLGDSNTELTSSSSGISLNNPVDAGISLEADSQDDASSDFDLSLEVEDTPKPSKSRPVEDSDSEFDIAPHKTPRPTKMTKTPPADSSEFELSLDSDADRSLEVKESDSSEFELSLEGSGDGGLTGDSDSEFELTLDDSGSLDMVEDEPAPQVKSKKKKGKADEQDIFDTDFEVPNLGDGDDATVADSELESSDFDLALDDSELAQEEESGSQVVALDEEDVETVSDDDAAVVDDVEIEEESSDFQDLDADVQVDDDAVEEDVETVGKVRTKTVVKEKLIPAAPWGVFPVVFMLPCVIIMFLVGILGYEMIQTTASAKQPGPLTQAIGEMFDIKFTHK